MKPLYEIRDAVAVVWLNTPNSKVNILNWEVLDQIRSNVDSVRDNPLIEAIVIISAKTRNFIAGADVNILSTFKCFEDVTRLSRAAQDMVTMIETFGKPVVAAVNGSCVGGGVETLLATHYNIALNNKHTTFMLPEVLLGLLPGAGGTQRLPRKIPLPDALSMMILGKEISAARAKQIGLINLLLEPPDSKDDNDESELREKLLRAAVCIAKKMAAEKIQLTSTPHAIIQGAYSGFFRLNIVRQMVLDRAKAEIEKLSYGLYPAPLVIVEVLRATLGLTDRSGYAIESEGFAKLALTKQHKALLGLFFGQTHCKRNHYGTPQRAARNLAILGASYVGAGIAQVSLLKDYHVIIKETDLSILHIGLRQIERTMAFKKIVGKEAARYLSKLETTVNNQTLKSVEMVIESASDDLSLKRKLLKESESVIPDDCVYAINTWITPVSQIANASRRKHMIVGMNYMAPVEKIKVVEIIKTNESSDNALATAIEVALGQGKMFFVVNDRPGFFVARVLSAVMLETVRIIQEGVHPLRLETLSKRVGFVAGLVSVADGTGLDVLARNAIYLRDAFGERFTGGSVNFLSEMVSNGMCGKRSKRGFFTYVKNKKTKTTNNAALEIVKRHKLETEDELTDKGIQNRLLLRFANEAIHCLQEGVIMTPLEGDIGSVFCLGFPPCLGGPFRWADMYGTDNIVNEMKALEKIYGPSFSSCDLLIANAKDLQQKFHNYDTFVI